MTRCDRDCFNCPYPDCILDDERLTLADYAEARTREELFLSPEQKKLAAKQRAYREANREEIAAKQRAYREANREEIAAKKRAKGRGRLIAAHTERRARRDKTSSKKADPPEVAHQAGRLAQEHEPAGGRPDLQGSGRGVL